MREGDGGYHFALCKPNVPWKLVTPGNTRHLYQTKEGSTDLRIRSLSLGLLYCSVNCILVKTPAAVCLFLSFLVSSPSPGVSVYMSLSDCISLSLSLFSSLPLSPSLSLSMSLSVYVFLSDP